MTWLSQGCSSLTHTFTPPVSQTQTHPHPPPMMAIEGQIRCKCLYYSTSLCLNLNTRGHPSFRGGCVVWGDYTDASWTLTGGLRDMCLLWDMRCPSTQGVKYGQKAGGFTAAPLALSHMLFSGLTLRLCWWRNVHGLINVSEDWTLNALQLLIWC